MFAYSHPLISQGDGRVKTDPVNESRIQLVLDRFQQWHLKRYGKLPSQLPIQKEQVEKSKIVYPLLGVAVGILSSYTFVHKNSKYIGKCFTLGCLYLGYKLANRYEKAYNSCRFFWNYPLYPVEIQKMIDNNDSRYAHRWLKDNYLQIRI